MHINDWISIAAVALSVLIGIALIYMIRKQIIKPEALDNAVELLDSVAVSGDGFISKLAEYARIAVRTVEQLAKTGVIGGDNDTKKKTAMVYVQQFAQADEIELTTGDLNTADLLIEAAVNELPHKEAPETA